MNPIEEGLEKFTSRIADYLMQAVNKSEHFDLMTLIRRIFSHRGLMDFETLVFNGIFELIELEEEEGFNTRLAARNAMLAVRLSADFKGLSTEVSLEEALHSTYVVRKSGRYSYMEIFWVYCAWRALGSDTMYSGLLAFFSDVCIDIRNGKIDSDEPNKPNFSLKTSSGKSRKEKDGVDIVQVMLIQLDAKLTSIRERVNNGSASLEEAQRDGFVLLH